MNTDTAIVLLLADLQRQNVALKNDNDTLRAHIAALEQPPEIPPVSTP